MAISTRRLCEVWQATDDMITQGVLYDLVMESLSPKEKEAYGIIRNNPGIDSMAIAEKMCIELNHAGGILKRMYTYGVLRRIYTDGGYFTWTIVR